MGGLSCFQGYIKREVIGVFLIALSILMVICLVSPSAGAATYLMETLLRFLMGEGRYVLPLVTFISGFKLLRGSGFAKQRLMGGFIMFLVLLVVVNTSTLQGLQWKGLVSGSGGGLLGAVLYEVLYRSFGSAGGTVVLVAFSTIGFIMCTGVSLGKYIRKLIVRLRLMYEKFKWGLLNLFFEEISWDEVDKTAVGDASLWSDKNDAQNQVSVAGKEAFLKEGLSQESVLRQNGLQYYDAGIDVKERNDGKYMLPPISLFQKSAAKQKNQRINKDLIENIKVLEKTLENFGVKAKVIHVSRGPAITRFEILPPRGVKVSRIVGLADDIALSMAVPNIRIEAPVPGKAAVGIEVPNPEVNTVHLRELLESAEFRQVDSRLTVALGKDTAGKVTVADLSNMPHLLIAGATGSGKSVCLNTIIAGILFKATPDEVKLLIIDPKKVELTTYNGIPHLISPVVTDPNKSATALRWAVKEMEYRYNLFASSGVRDIIRYNSNMCVNDGGNALLPYIVIIIDELADLMMIAPNDVEDSICRLAQMARAAGIHLIVATQRPSVDVITGLIKANITSRISFVVSSQIDSRTVLDMSGAEKLLGRGDMLFMPVGTSKPLRLQGAYLSDGEAEKLAGFWKGQDKPIYNDQIIREMQQPCWVNHTDDKLFLKAVEIFMNSGHASVSLLQRKLRIGYARAARLMDVMEKKGIVSGYQNGKPRTILITQKQYESFYRKNNTI